MPLGSLLHQAWNESSVISPASIYSFWDQMSWDQCLCHWAFIHCMQISANSCYCGWNVKKKKKNQKSGWWFFSQGFYCCHLDEGRLHILQNGLLFCQKQMSVKSCIGMIECVLQQHAVEPVGVGKLNERETLKAESFHSDSLCVCF